MNGRLVSIVGIALTIANEIRSGVVLMKSVARERTYATRTTKTKSTDTGRFPYEAVAMLQLKIDVCKRGH